MTREVYIWGRGLGTEPKAVALVDDEDYLRVIGYYPWQVNTKGYALSTSHRVLMHRLILGLERGSKEPAIDHINRDKLDNRRANLRIATPAENSQNCGARTGGTSRYRGVSWDKRAGCWCAGVQINGHNNWLGRFDDELQAASAAARFRAERLPHITEPHPELLAQAAA